MLSLNRLLARNSANFTKLITRKDWTAALNFIETEAESELQLDKKNVNSIMWGLANSGKAAQAYKFLQILPRFNIQPSEVHYIAVIEGCLKHDKKYLALNVFYQSQIFGFSLDAVTYNMLISRLDKSAGIKNAKYILECMLKDKMTPSASSCIVLLKLAQAQKDFGFAEDILLIMYKAGYEMPSKIVNSFFTRSNPRSEEFASLRETWRKIQEEAALESEESDLEDRRHDKLKSVPKLLTKVNIEERFKLPLSFEVIVMPQDLNENGFDTDDLPDSDDNSEPEK